MPTKQVISEPSPGRRTVVATFTLTEDEKLESDYANGVIMEMLERDGFRVTGVEGRIRPDRPRLFFENLSRAFASSGHYSVKLIDESASAE